MNDVTHAGAMNFTFSYSVLNQLLSNANGLNPLAAHLQIHLPLLAAGFGPLHL
jgi:hypothetical protein